MMSNLFGVAVIISLAAVTAWDVGPTTSVGDQPVVAQSQCSAKQKTAKATNVRLVKLTDELRLTPNQVTKLSAIFNECRTSCATTGLTAQFAPLVEEIHALKSAENPDYEAIKTKKAEIKALQERHASKLAAYRADLVAEIKTVLTAEQVAKFEQVQSELLGDDVTLVASMK